MDEQKAVYSIGLLKACQWCHRGMNCDDCVSIANKHGEEALDLAIGKFGVRASAERIREGIELETNPQ